MHNSAPLATRLNLLIHSANSQKEVARLAQVSDGTFINWLRGHGVRESKLRQVARNLGVSLEWLRNGVGDDQAELAAFQAKLHPVPDGPSLRVRAAREQAGLSLMQLAERTGYGAIFHDMLEQGTIRASRQAIAALCHALPSLSYDDLLQRWGYSVADKDKEKLPWSVGLDGTQGRFVPLIPSEQTGKVDIKNVDMDDGYIMVFAVNLNDPRAFAIRVSGNSMRPALRDGDLVVCSPAQKITNGDAAVVRTRSAQVFIKYWQKRDDLVVLESANLKYQPLKLPRVEIVGAWPIVQAIRVGKMPRPSAEGVRRTTRPRPRVADKVCATPPQ